MLIELVAVLILAASNAICYLCHHKSSLRGRCRGPGLLFITNRAASQASRLPEEYWALDVLDPAHLVSSHLLSARGVLLLRAGCLAFFGLTLLLEGVTGDGFGDPGNWFTFFTNWSFLLLGVWAALGCCLSARALQAPRPAFALPEPEHESSTETVGIVSSQPSDAAEGSGGSSGSSRPKWDALSTAFLFVSQTVATATLFLSFFYWSFLFSPQAPLEIDNVLKHGANVGVLLLDVCLTRVPFVSYHFQVILWYGTAYTLFMWAFHALSLRWVYYILDWSQPTALVLYALNPLFLFAAFLAWSGVACGREWLGSKLRPRQRMSSLQWADFQTD